MNLARTTARERHLLGMTLVEMMVAVALSGIVLAILGALFVNSLMNFAGLGNYAELTNKSRLSLDRMSREMREATAVIACTTNLPIKRLTLTNSIQAKVITYAWDSTTGIFTVEKTGEPAQVLLTGCESWDFSFYQRTPKSNWGFYPTKDLKLIKLINMNWKCSRTVVARVNTETVVTSQVVLRNKP